jgi:hypothetical protein
MFYSVFAWKGEEMINPDALEAGPYNDGKTCGEKPILDALMPEIFALRRYNY